MSERVWRRAGGVCGDVGRDCVFCVVLRRAERRVGLVAGRVRT